MEPKLQDLQLYDLIQEAKQKHRADCRAWAKPYLTEIPDLATHLYPTPESTDQEHTPEDLLRWMIGRVVWARLRMSCTFTSRICRAESVNSRKCESGQNDGGSIPINALQERYDEGLAERNQPTGMVTIQ